MVPTPQSPVNRKKLPQSRDSKKDALLSGETASEVLKFEREKQNSNNIFKPLGLVMLAIMMISFSIGIMEMTQLETSLSEYSNDGALNFKNPNFLNTSNHPIVLFDGVCSLCHGVVQTLLKIDDSVLRFAKLQSEVGLQLLQMNNLPNDLSTIVFVENGRAFTKSTAALRIIRHLPHPYPLLYYLLMLIPKQIRDLGYEFVGRSRYQVFGKVSECLAPSPSFQSRFLDKMPLPPSPRGIPPYLTEGYEPPTTC